MFDKHLNRILAFIVFLTTIVVYFKTLSVTVVFWDVGEFCAAAYLMQVPHPPGSPFFLIIAKVVSLVPFLPDIAARMHAVSALSAALGAMFLYLATVKIIGRINNGATSVVDKIIVYGASFVGALTLAFTTTYWDNAIEAEVYGLSMLFVSVIMWLILRWWERAEEPHNEKYILLIAYLIGLSTGVHLLALLAVFPVMMLIYFRLYAINKRSLILFGIITLVTFIVIYPGIVQYLPSMLDGDFKGFKFELLPFVPVLILIAAAWGVYKAYQTKHRLLHIACLSFILIVLGYTTYTGVIIRSNARPPMNENSPDNLAGLVSYLSREQYGDTPLLRGESWDNNLQDYREKVFPRRYSREAMHEETRTKYKDDFDFFWRYQTQHMFVRYVLWNFVGTEGDWQDAGVSWKDTWGIPLLLGLFGIAFQFWKDRKMSLTLLVTFVVMGFVLAWYQNQQEPQPRERDYFYVGAYYVYSIWIAIGVYGIFNLLRDVLKNTSAQMAIASLLVIVSLGASPINLLRVNYFEHDRSKNYIAWDYSYNILQSCEPDAILFTNGDNDTFPLWYLQDVEGVRRDIRIVNLSLVNTPWYILQLKNETPHGAKKVPMSLSDQAIQQIEPRPWKPRQMELPVPKDALQQFLNTDRPQFANWTLDSTVEQQQKITFTVNGVPYNNELRFLRVQDLMIWEIIRANNWQRPVYFAATCSPDSKLGLDEYLWMQGLALKLKPFKIPSYEAGMDIAQMETNLFSDVSTPSKTFQSGFLWRQLNNHGIYYNENTQRMVMNYRASFFRGYQYATYVVRDNEKAKKFLQRMEQVIPVDVIPNLGWQFTAQSMSIFRSINDMPNFEKYAKITEKKCLELLETGAAESAELNPYQLLLEIYETRKDYSKALDIAQRWKAQFQAVARDPQYANDRRFQQQMMMLDQSISMYQQNLKGATGPDSLSQ